MRSIKLLGVMLVLSARSFAQDTTDIMSQLEKDPKKINYTMATFKSTRVINGHSVENIGKGVLDVRILHRFAPLNTGIYNFFGIDQASMRMGFDYGITKNIMIGVGHSTWQKTYDGLIKIKILRQSTGAVNMPFTLSFLSTIAVRTQLAKDADPDPVRLRRVHTSFAAKTSYVQQIIIGRKFSNNFSLQLMPTYITHNRIDSANKYTLSRDTVLYGPKRKNTFAIGAAARLKVSKRISLTAEYYYQLENAKPENIFNNISLGIDIETGGHVFQMHFTNSNGMTEKSFITDTDDKWRYGYIRFGFNISRVFNVGKH